MIDDVLFREACCGCGACGEICPTEAIRMGENARGFIIASVQADKCIHCDLCDKICPVKTQQKQEEITCYALKLSDTDSLMQSQSGGAFYAVAKSILQEGGVVYGVSNEDIRDVRTVRVDCLEDLHKLLKSKYVQADSTQTHELVEEDLRSGRTVFYSGTACVVQGLKNYLSHRKVSQMNLLTCDLICHGVPSRSLDRDFIARMEKKQKSRVTGLLYRDKSKGWGSHQECYTFADGNKYHTNEKVIVFSKGFSLSSACFQCEFTTPYRVADMTIGDFWSLGQVGMSINQFPSGLSVCLVRNAGINRRIRQMTENGELQCSEIHLEHAMQWNLERPSVKPVKYDVFWRKYARNRFKTLWPVYFALTSREKAGRMCRKILSRLRLKR